MPPSASILKDIALFGQMDDEERSAIAAMMTEVHFDRGAQIFYERDPGDVCYVLCQGRVELSVVDDSGEKIRFDSIEAGELLGELSLLDGGTRSATAIAQTAVDALVLHTDDFLSFLKKRPEAALHVMVSLAGRMRKTDRLLKHRIEDPNRLIAKQTTLGDRVSDAMAMFGGSWSFVILFITIMLIWVTVNGVFKLAVDPFPFILLNLILSMVAALQAPVIMMSQNRQDIKDRIRSEADYRVNVRAEIAIGELHHKIDALEKRLHDWQSGRTGGRETPEASSAATSPTSGNAPG